MTRKYPFEASFEELEANLNEYVSSVFSSLESEFLILPKGPGFIDYPVFEAGYEALKKATAGFMNFSSQRILPVVSSVPISFIVIRSILGFTPPEWAYLATQRTRIEVSQGFARTLDRKIRMSPFTPVTFGKLGTTRVNALIETACQLLRKGPPKSDSSVLHRLDKADTRDGIEGTRHFSEMGVPYSVLLYERFLGRPFASHRDSISELIGDVLELKIEEILRSAGISYRKTKRAQRIEGFDQAPDFVVPSEFNVKLVIEAKVTEDDGTARDKITRIQHLERISLQDQPSGRPRFEVIACISGRGFGVRFEDMKKLLMASRGKVFTLKTLDQIVEHTRLREYRTKN